MSNLPKGAILQRDKETYAIRITPPSGVVTPEELEKLAAVAYKYDIPYMKLTSGQRFALMGLKETEIPSAIEELPFRYGGHYVQGCPGTDWCSTSMQDSMGVAKELEKRFGSAATPAKIKMGVSGCSQCCAESYVRDLGLIGTKKGWTLVIGGNAAGRPRIADVLAKNLTTDEAFEMVSRLLEYYTANGKTKQRMARFVEAHGIESIRNAISA